MRIMAIDPAITTGVCVGEVGETPKLSSHTFREDENEPPEKIFGRAMFWLADYLRNETVDMIAIEAPFPSQKFDTSMITLGLFAIFTGIADCKGIPTTRVQISTWRKHFIGKGNQPGIIAKGLAVQRCKLLGWIPEDHNSAEAAGIWDWAGATFMGKIPEALHLFGEKAS
jgi:hypothetical protein